MPHCGFRFPLPRCEHIICQLLNGEWVIFGKAPAEAEAELAYLNRIGVLDTILTEDNDVFVFGAMRIIRNRLALLKSSQAHSHQVFQHLFEEESQCYEALCAGCHCPPHLKHKDLVLIALLVGGDYNPVSVYIYI